MGNEELGAFGGAEVAADTFGGMPAATGAQPTIALGGRRSPDEERLIMETDRLHGEVIAGMSAYHELHHELVAADMPTSSGRCCGSSSHQGGEPS